MLLGRLRTLGFCALGFRCEGFREKGLGFRAFREEVRV